MRILSVDDNPENLYLLETIFKQSNYEVESAANGKEALRRLEKGSYDLIVSDILMPEMDGFQLCREVKKSEALKRIPFVFYTATYTEEKDREFALSLGANRFIIKPEEPDHFLAIIDEVLRNHRAGDFQPSPGGFTSDAQYMEAYSARLHDKIDQKVKLLKELQDKLHQAISDKNREMGERLRAEAVRQVTETRFNSIYENAIEGMFQVSPDGAFFHFNPALAGILGFESPVEAQVLYAGDNWRKIVSAKDLEHVLSRLAGQDFVKGHEMPLQLRDGGQAWVLVNIRKVRSPDGPLLYYEGSVMDISDRKSAEDALRDREAFVEAVVENIPDMIFVKEAERLRFVRLNKAGEDLLGISREALYGCTDYDFFPEEEASFFVAKDRQVLEGGSLAEIPEEPIQTRRHGLRVLHTKKIPIYDINGKAKYILGISEDITERKQAEEKIKASLREKELLLRELCHRTKNNMQVILSILSLHTQKVRNAETEPVFRDIENRIMAMALVHQKLYQSENLSSIDFRSYLDELVALIFSSHNVSCQQVTTRRQVATIPISIDVAVPCGLVLHELLSNTLRHAFPGGRTGEIDLRIERNGDTVELNYADNGVGFAPGFDPRTDGAMGLKTLFLIVELQLQGNIAFTSENGVSCRITFKDNLYARRV